MASPQTENGYTRIANELLEAIYKTDFNGTQLRIMLLIARKTYGFNRKSHPLSLSTMHKTLGGNMRNIRRELQRLIDSSVILVFSDASFKNAREIGINKNFEEWTGKFSPEVSSTTTEGELAHTTEGELAHTTEGELAPHEINNKEILKKDARALFESLWMLYPEKKGKVRVTDKTIKELAAHGYDVIKRCIDRYSADKPDWQQWQHGSSFFNGGYIDYLDENYKVSIMPTGEPKKPPEEREDY